MSSLLAAYHLLYPCSCCGLGRDVVMVVLPRKPPGGPSTFPRPAVQSTFISRGTHRPQMHKNLGSASIHSRDRACRIHPLIVLESVKRDHGGERSPRSLRNSLHGRCPVHSPLSLRSHSPYQSPFRVSKLRTRQTPVLRPELAALCT